MAQNSFTIATIHAREVLDSRGNPTVEVDLTLKDGAFGRAAVPSGASTGSREALELRDGDRSRYLGKGVTKAVGAVNGPIASRIQGMTIGSQLEFDELLLNLDGTPNKSTMGANALLGCSMAFCRAAAQSRKLPLYRWIAEIYQPAVIGILPVPLMNIFNGGAHALNGLDFQEFMVVPAGAPSFREALRMGAEIFHHLKVVLSGEHLATTVGDEGGFAPNLDDYENKHEQAFEFIVQAVESAGYKLGKDIFLALDAAASEFFDEGRYQFEGRARTPTEMISYYESLITEYPVISIEDGLSEKDWDGWKALTAKIGVRCQLVGDDIFVTNPAILKEGIATKAANSILIKLNQIGTVTETLRAMRMAMDAGFTTVVSHRSGETEDAFLADLAVGTGSGQIKTGSLSRSDRTAKYNQLLRIEEELGSQAKYLGLKSFSGVLKS